MTDKILDVYDMAIYISNKRNIPLDTVLGVLDEEGEYMEENGFATRESGGLK